MKTIKPKVKHLENVPAGVLGNGSENFPSPTTFMTTGNIRWSQIIAHKITEKGHKYERRVT